MSIWVNNKLIRGMPMDLIELIIKQINEQSNTLTYSMYEDSVHNNKKYISMEQLEDVLRNNM